MKRPPCVYAITSAPDSQLSLLETCLVAPHSEQPTTSVAQLVDVNIMLKHLDLASPELPGKQSTETERSVGRFAGNGAYIVDHMCLVGETARICQFCPG